MRRKLPNKEVARLKRQVRELMARDRQRLLMRFPFTGGVAMRLDLVPVHDCRLSTCSTDYENIYADIDFYSRLNSDERLHVLAHEIWHCILLHGLRRQGRDRRRFNYAADLEIFFLLDEEGLGCPFHLPYLESWLYMRPSAEEFYERMPELEKAIEAGGGADFVPGAESENIKAGGSGRGFDKHAEATQSGNENGSSPQDENEGEQGDEEAFEPYYDDDYLPGWRVAAAEAMRGKVVATAQQIERQQGELPGHVMGIVKAMLKPEIRWQDLLAQFVTSCYGGSRRWLPPSRRHIGRGLYLQSSRMERLKAVVAVDTSGSTANDLPRFFSELSSLLNTFGSYELTVIQADAKIQSVRKFDDASPYEETADWAIGGLGGTDFRPAFDYVAENLAADLACLIYVTDGYGPVPDRAPGYPVLWMLTADGTPPASWGHVARFPTTKKEKAENDRQ